MRELFLLDPEIVFLNHGSFGACPREVFQAYQAHQLDLERNPVAFLSRESGARLLEARRCLADFLGTTADRLVFVSNATTGVNTVARSLDLAEGDEILTTDHEYGACVATWDFVCRRAGARLVRAEIPLPFDRETFLETLWSRVTPRTRMIFLSHITSSTALIFPLEELCRRARAAGIPTLVDGAHAPGQLDLALDDLGADFYIGNCHKWLCAPKGAAFLHARPEHHRELEASVVSWGYCPESLGNPGYEAYTGTGDLERRLQWQGTRDLAAFLAVPAAIGFQIKMGWPQVRAACHDLAAHTGDRIGAMTGLPPISDRDGFGQMVSIPLPQVDGPWLKGILYDRHHIEIPITTHRGSTFLRLSVQGYNTPEDGTALVEAMDDILRRHPERFHLATEPD